MLWGWTFCDFCFLLNRLSPVFKSWDTKWSNMWTRRSFTQLITSGIQKRSQCCGPSSRSATASLLSSALSHQVSALAAFYREQWLMWRPRAANCLFRMGRRLGIRDWWPHWPVESVREKWDERQLHRKPRRHDGLAVYAVAGEINEIASKHELIEKLSIRLQQYLRALLWRRRC